MMMMTDDDDDNDDKWQCVVQRRETQWSGTDVSRERSDVGSLWHPHVPSKGLKSLPVLLVISTADCMITSSTVDPLMS